MNFFKHHLGDYAAATAHLSWDEDMAYTRLMRVYYQHEKPIPEDPAQACRLARATTPAQKRAVQAVLTEFFTLEADGWHQKRCDEEIAVMQKKAEQNREIGKLGGRPKKQKEEPKENPDGFQSETQTVSRNNPSQNPESTNQKPGEKNKRVAALSCSDLMADGLTEETANEWLTFRKQKRAPLTATAWSGIKAEAGRAGWSLQDVVTKCMARGWQGFEAEWVAPQRHPGHARQSEGDRRINDFLTGFTPADDGMTIDMEAIR